MLFSDKTGQVRVDYMTSHSDYDEEIFAKMFNQVHEIIKQFNMVWIGTLV